MPSIELYGDLKGGANNVLQIVEKSLDCAGYFWIVAPLTGGLRIIYGQVEIITAATLLVFFQIAALFCSKENKKFYYKESDSMVDYVLHGMANIFRGEIECTSLINISCLVYDFFVAKEKESLRLSYNKPLNWVQNLQRFYHHGHRV